jgi:hypothetical protein
MERTVDKVSELDKWFPRPERKPDPEKPPEQGVIQGVKRAPRRRYARRWWKIVRKEKDNER